VSGNELPPLARSAIAAKSNRIQKSQRLLYSSHPQVNYTASAIHCAWGNLATGASCVAAAIFLDCWNNNQNNVRAAYRNNNHPNNRNNNVGVRLVVRRSTPQIVPFPQVSRLFDSLSIEARSTRSVE
jgi:hypothetical protein